MDPSTFLTTWLPANDKYSASVPKVEFRTILNKPYEQVAATLVCMCDCNMTSY